VLGCAEVGLLGQWAEGRLQVRLVRAIRDHRALVVAAECLALL